MNPSSIFLCGFPLGSPVSFEIPVKIGHNGYEMCSKCPGMHQYPIQGLFPPPIWCSQDSHGDHEQDKTLIED